MFPLASKASIGALIERLESLQDGASAVADLIASGPTAVGPLRTFLLKGRPRSTYEPRRWAVEALGALGRKDILIEFLSQRKDICDSAVRFAEDAVENAAAMELARWKTDDVFCFLLRLTAQRIRVGFIRALGEFTRTEAIPYFDKGLEDDLCRSAAEDAFRKLGSVAVRTLVLSATVAWPASTDENPSSLRRRRSSITLLGDIGITKQDWRSLKALINESDVEIAVRTIALGVRYVDACDGVSFSKRLVDALDHSPWFLLDDISAALIDLAPFSTAVIESAIQARTPHPLNAGLMALLRARHRITTTNRRRGHELNLSREGESAF